MLQTSFEDHYRRAAQRHHTDAVYLHDDSRLPNADHHYGFAVECALKSMMLRYGGASMVPKSAGGNSPIKPWIGTDKKDLGHLPNLWRQLPLHIHGRSGGQLHTMLTTSDPFSTWDVGDRYRDGTTVTVKTVQKRKMASIAMLALDQQSSLAARIP